VSEIIERAEVLLPGPAQALGALLGVPVPDDTERENFRRSFERITVQMQSR